MTRRLPVVLRSQCRDGAMDAMTAQVLGTSRSVPLDALQGFRKVLGEKERHEAVASEASKPPLPSGEKRNDKDPGQ